MRSYSRRTVPRAATRPGARRANPTEGPRGVCVMRLVCGTQRVHGCVWSYGRRTVPARGQVARVWRVSPNTRGARVFKCARLARGYIARLIVLVCVWSCERRTVFRPRPCGSVRWRAIPTRAPRCVCNTCCACARFARGLFARSDAGGESTERAPACTHFTLCVFVLPPVPECPVEPMPPAA